jgi:hypothetical protein
MTRQCIFTIRCEIADEFATFVQFETSANAYVLQRAGVIVETEEERADCGTLAVLTPAEADDDTVTI